MPHSSEREAPYVGLTAAFAGTFALFSLVRPRRSVETSAIDLAMLGLATFRLGRLIAYDVVLKPVREPFTDTVPDPTGAGETVAPEGRGFRRAMGELISCPICAGTWAAAALVYGLHLFPTPARVFTALMAAVGLAELLGSAQEALQWNAQVARLEAGRRERLIQYKPDLV